MIIDRKSNNYFKCDKLRRVNVIMKNNRSFRVMLDDGKIHEILKIKNSDDTYDYRIQPTK